MLPNERWKSVPRTLHKYFLSLQVARPFQFSINLPNNRSFLSSSYTTNTSTVLEAILMALFTSLENSQHCKKQRAAFFRIPLQCLQKYNLASQNTVSKFYKMCVSFPPVTQTFFRSTEHVQHFQTLGKLKDDLIQIQR